MVELSINTSEESYSEISTCCAPTSEKHSTITLSVPACGVSSANQSKSAGVDTRPVHERLSV